MCFVSGDDRAATAPAARGEFALFREMISTRSGGGDTGVPPCADASAPPPYMREGPAPTPASEQVERRRRLELALLVQLRHAHTRSCSAPECAADARLEAHARACRAGEACTVRLCWPARCVMAHYARCADAACPLCVPARRTPADVCVRGGGGISGDHGGGGEQ